MGQGGAGLASSEAGAVVERLGLRLDTAAARQRAALAKKPKLPKAAVVRMAIRQMAKREGVEAPQDTRRGLDPQAVASTSPCALRAARQDSSPSRWAARGAHGQ